MIKVIFLDIDGVLNNHASLAEGIQLVNQKCCLIKRIVDETGAKIVISSTWRMGQLMMPTDHDIYIDIQYVMDTNEFRVNSNAKDPAYIVEKFLETQMSAGEDHSPVNVKEEYNISLRLDLSEDRFLCSHDCGNKGLLLHYIRSKTDNNQ